MLWSVAIGFSSDLNLSGAAVDTIVGNRRRSADALNGNSEAADFGPDCMDVRNYRNTYSSSVFVVVRAAGQASIRA